MINQIGQGAGGSLAAALLRARQLASKSGSSRSPGSSVSALSDPEADAALTRMQKAQALLAKAQTGNTDGLDPAQAQTSEEASLLKGFQAVATLKNGSKELKSQRKAMARQKLEQIKQQLAAARMMAGGDPKALARLAARLAKELASAARAYAQAGGGGGAELSVDVTTTTVSSTSVSVEVSAHQETAGAVQDGASQSGTASSGASSGTAGAEGKAAAGDAATVKSGEAAKSGEQAPTAASTSPQTSGAAAVAQSAQVDVKITVTQMEATRTEVTVSQNGTSSSSAAGAYASAANGQGSAPATDGTKSERQNDQDFVTQVRSLAVQIRSLLEQAKALARQKKNQSAADDHDINEASKNAQDDIEQALKEIGAVEMTI